MGKPPRNRTNAKLKGRNWSAPHIKPASERKNMSTISVDRKKLIIALAAAERGADNLDGLLCALDSSILDEERVAVGRTEKALKRCIDILQKIISPKP
jgi:hypothetical protein